MVIRWQDPGRGETRWPAAGRGSRRLDLHAIGAFPIQLTWSPDASRFAFVRDGNVWTATRDGSDLHDVTSLPLGGAADVSWSPDGSLLAVDGRHGLWLVAPDGSGRRWIRLGPGDSINAMKWSPSSRMLAIEIDTEGVGALRRSSVVLVDPTGGPATGSRTTDSAGLRMTASSLSRWPTRTRKGPGISS